MVLHENLRNTNITKADMVTSYLTKITQLRDELATLGEIIPDDQLNRIALTSFPMRWDVFVDAILAREHLRDWVRMCDYLI